MKKINKQLARWAQSEFNRRGGKLQAVILDPAYPADGVGTFIVALRKRGELYVGVEIGTGNEYTVTEIGEFAR
jgi:hypothetical protein